MKKQFTLERLIKQITVQVKPSQQGRLKGGDDSVITEETLVL